MRKFGLLAGIGPESSIEYYRLIIKRFQQRLNTNDYPELMLFSINMTQMLDYVFNARFDELTKFLAEKISVIERAGCDIGAMASNTPHIVFDQLNLQVNIPLISIVEETVRYASGIDVKRAALFGTKSTMSGGFYKKTAEKYGIDIVVPGQEEQEFIHQKYMNELVLNVVRPETKKQLLRVVKELIHEQGIDALILGGTELPLILGQNDFNDIQLLDSTKIHVERIVEKILA